MALLPDLDQLGAAVKLIASKRPPCILCGGKPKMVGVFIPKHVEEFADTLPADGKVRTAFYTLCLRCMTIPTDTRSERVEAAIRNERMGFRP